MILVILLVVPAALSSAVMGLGDQFPECHTTVQNFYGPQAGSGGSEEGSLVGPQGVPGKRGPVGERGRVGARGQRGIPGQKGEKGEIPSEIIEDILRMRVQLEELESRTQRVNKTCAHIREDSTMESGFYLISPNPAVVRPFYVFCNFTEDQAYTVFGHDSEEERDVEKCAAPRCYSHNIKYHNSMLQMRSVVQQSLACRQYIKYRCQGSVFNWRNSSPFAAWRSFDGEDRYNWGGSRIQHTCQCGLTDSCAGGKTDRCNCDNNSEDLMTSDEGYLDEKQFLPVINLKFGDTDGSAEHGWHTLGKLECFGIKTE